MLPVPGKDLQGVIAYRDIADTHTMIDAAATHQHAVVIGGGLLGLEAANGLKLRGMDVTVVHIMPWLMERQLDAVAGKLLQKLARAARPPVPDRRADRRAARQRAGPRARPSSSRTAARSRPTWW